MTEPADEGIVSSATGSRSADPRDFVSVVVGSLALIASDFLEGKTQTHESHHRNLPAVGRHFD